MLDISGVQWSWLGLVYWQMYTERRADHVWSLHCEPCLTPSPSVGLATRRAGRLADTGAGWRGPPPPWWCSARLVRDPGAVHCHSLTLSGWRSLLTAPQPAGSGAATPGSLCVYVCEVGVNE